MIVLGVIVFIVVPGLFILEVLRCLYLEYRRDRVPIILYHRLISKADVDQGRVPDNEMIWVSYDTVFAEQMAYLHKAGYTTLDFDDYMKIRSGEMPLPSMPVIVTFDDGYLSNFTMAYPALKKYGQKAVIFVPLEPDDHTRNQVQGIDGFFDAAQMREMADNRISIQSHTLTHCILTELDDEAIRYELNESRRRLAEITGRPVDHIAIPRAGYSRRIMRLVAAAGYRTACCNNKGAANGLSNPLALPRIVIERDMSVGGFARCLTPRFSLMLRILGNIKRMPERIGGARFARQVRNLLYIKPLQPIFRTRNLKKVICMLGVLYLAGSVWFVWYRLTSW